ncbi:hypothetical protein ACPXB5_23580 [Micromonospora arida]|uniref:hypothetical protein n=1 Tax=Micromonospora arida TaxID=2203715 RepID=UPI003CFBAF95
MARKFMFATDQNGRSHEVKVDPKHLDRQKRDLERCGNTVVVLDEDERIRMGLIAQQLHNR